MSSRRKSPKSVLDRATPSNVAIRFGTPPQDILVAENLPHVLHNQITRALKHTMNTKRPNECVLELPPLAGAVPDRIRYYYSAQGHLVNATKATFDVDGCEIPVGKDVNSLEEGQRTVVILLESPHVDEVDKRWNPFQPAAGSTGKNIHENKALLERLLRSTLKIGHRYPVVIANPVPYPTSCRVSTRRWGWWRDLVFRRLIHVSEIRRFFRQRLDFYNPALVINACTDGAGTCDFTVNPTPLGFSLSVGQCKPPSPKIMVSRIIESQLGNVYVIKYTKVEFAALGKAAPKAVTIPAGAVPIIDLPHPASWES